MNILQLKIYDMGGVEAFELDARGEHVVIGGKNGAGKSTILRCIAGALGGMKERGPDPLRHGAKEGKVVIDLGDLVVRWRVTDEGKHALSVETKEGAILKSPQAKLQQLFGERTFDPLAFYNKQPEEQARIVADLFGVDFAAFDSRRKEIFDERTTINRLAKEYAAQAKGLELPDDYPAEPVDVSALAEQLREAERGHAKLRSWREQLGGLEQEEQRLIGVVDFATKNKATLIDETLKSADDDIAAATQAVIDAQTRLARMKTRREERFALAERQGDKTIAEAQLRLDETKERIEKGRTAIADLEKTTVDVVPLERQLNEAEAINRVYEIRRRKDELEALAMAKRDESAALTVQIQEIDQEKLDAIAAANIPLDGVSIVDNIVTWHGKQLKSISASEQLRFSVALDIARHPELAIMLIDKWGDLDDDGRAIMREMADAAGVQIWTTVVGTKDEDINVVIREGRISK